MKVTITNDEVQVTVEADGGYAPDVMRDLVARAVDTYQLAFADDEDDEQT